MKIQTVHKLFTKNKIKNL